MFKEKLLLEKPYSRIRRTLAVVLYVLFMIWIIYSHSKTNNVQTTVTKKSTAAFP